MAHGEKTMTRNNEEPVDAVIAERVGEWSTEQIVRLGGDLYYRHPNGGARGAHNRQDGDGVWRERPVEPSRELGVSEARRLLLDWGYDPAEVVQMLEVSRG